MTIRRPRKIKVKDSDYKTTSKDTNWFKREKAFGKITYADKEIELYKTKDRKEFVDTVIHELAHAILFEYMETHLTKKLEEKVVTAIANGLTDIMINNKKLIYWFLVQLENYDNKDK